MVACSVEMQKNNSIELLDWVHTSPALERCSFVSIFCIVCTKNRQGATSVADPALLPAHSQAIKVGHALFNTSLKSLQSSKNVKSSE